MEKKKKSRKEDPMRERESRRNKTRRMTEERKEMTRLDKKSKQGARWK